MSEMEKFKRRIIRSVARKFITEKIPQCNVWKDLKKETGIECKLLWERMRALTLKKLIRMMKADDLVQEIPRVARMSLTDWLLFDLVLVHEDIDLIGRFKQQTDPIPLIELMFIIHKLDLEGKSGNELAEAWTKATIIYNGRTRRCSPMLLQKRWHQLKKATRSNFYDFWFSYRGSEKLLLKAKAQHMPSKLQMAIAKRYTHIIIKPFMDWNESIEKKYVILPNDFEKKIQISQEPTKAADVQPDLVLVEPNIETINLDDKDSGPETVQEDTKYMIDLTSNTSDTIELYKTIKTEAVDDVNSENLPTLSKSEQLLKRHAQLLASIETDCNLVVNYNKLADSTIDKTKNNTITEDYIPLNHNEIIDNKKEYEKKENDHIPSKKSYTDNGNIAEINNEIIEVDNDNVCLSPNKELEEQIVMPQITNVFGNVHICTDVLAELSNMSANKFQDNSTSTTAVATDVESTRLSSNKLNLNQTETENISNVYTKNMFLDIPSGLTFVDNGIELFDDGFEFIDDGIKLVEEDDTQFKKSAEAIDLCETTDEEDDGTDKFDVKLFMQPVVCAIKLEDIKVFKDKGFNCVTNILKSTIVESQFECIRSVYPEIQLNDNTNTSVTVNKHLCNNESCDDGEYISENQKVKLSSHLLQKPRSRSYNPIQLCKNPDFNTRLKRLTVGFLSSTRNRSLLKTLKPATVDVSKAFETKLVNGTLYLMLNDTTDAVTVEDDVSEQSSAVLPSAMLAQSLIDNTKVHIRDILPHTSQKTIDVVNSPKQNADIIPERNKVINLPDIDAIRRMNQRLFTAEITPMRVQTARKSYKPPVQLVQVLNNYELLHASQSMPTSTSSRSNIPNVGIDHFSELNLPEKSLVSNFLPNEPSVSNKSSHHPIPSSLDNEPIKPTSQKQRKTPLPSWLCRPTFPKGMKFDKGLLTIDALQKMLSVMKEGILISDNFQNTMLANLVREIELKNKPLEETSNKLNQQKSEKEKVPEVNKLVPLASNIPVANKIINKPFENIPKIKPIKPKPLPKPKLRPKPKPKLQINVPTTINNEDIVKGKDCCWARRKLNDPSNHSRHWCIVVCRCCCRTELAAARAAFKEKNQVISSRHRKTLSHACPIFLGKKYILLTNESLPKDFDIQTAPPKMVTTELVVPKGVQIVLLPNGQLSYTVSPSVNLTAEEIATLPAILATVREQLCPPSTSVESANKVDHSVYQIEESDINLTLESHSNSTRQVLENTGTANEEDSIDMTNIVPKESKESDEVTYDGPTYSDKKVHDIQTQHFQLITTTNDEIKNISNTKHIQKYFSQYSGSVLPTSDLVGQDDKKDNSDIPLESNATVEKDLSNLSSESVLPILDLAEPDDKIYNSKITLESYLTTQKDYSKTSSKSVIPTLDSRDNSGVFLKSTLKNNYSNPESKSVFTTLDSVGRGDKTDNSANILESNATIKMDFCNISLNPESVLPTITSSEQDEDEKKDESVLSTLNSVTEENKRHDIEIPSESNVTSNKNAPATDFHVIKKGIAIADTPVETNKSNLLSDLMEMFGISSEDTNLLNKKAPCEKLPVLPLTPVTPPIPHTPPRYLQTAVNAPPIITTSPSSNIPELCTIASYAHLKYAFDRNAKFFKLNIETGAVLPIHIFLRKNLTASDLITVTKPMPNFIDLTNEQDTPEVPVVVQSVNTGIDKEEPSPSTNPVTPLKLFRSVNILQKKRSIAARKGLPKEIVSQVDQKEKTKQTLNKAPIQMDTEIRNEVNMDLDLQDGFIRKDTNEESDDQPLATVAKRKRLNIEPEELSTDSQTTSDNNEINPINEINLIEDFDIEGIIPANVITGGGVTYSNDLCFLSDQENESAEGEQDNCILGV